MNVSWLGPRRSLHNLFFARPAAAIAEPKESKMAKAEAVAGRTIKIQWYRSTIGANRGQKQIVRSLGLTKLNQVVERPDTDSTRGMVGKVPHLLRIVE